MIFGLKSIESYVQNFNIDYFITRCTSGIDLIFETKDSCIQI